MITFFLRFKSKKCQLPLLSEGSGFYQKPKFWIKYPPPHLHPTPPHNFPFILRFCLNPMQLFKFADPTMVGQLVFLNLIAIYKNK